MSVPCAGSAPVVTLTAVTPDEITQNETTTMVVTGTGFADDSRVFVGGFPRLTYVASNTELYAQFEVRTLGSVDIQVVNGRVSGEGPRSNVLTVPVVPGVPIPPPVLTAVTPNPILITPNTRQNIVITGTGFTPEAVVFFGDDNYGPAAVVTPTELTFDSYFSAADVGDKPVSVRNGGLVSERSNALPFVISMPPVPVVTSIAPNTTPANVEFDFAVHGSGFAWASGVVNVDGVSIGASVNPGVDDLIEVWNYVAATAGAKLVTVKDAYGQESAPQTLTVT